MIIVKVTKNQLFILSLENVFFKKPQGEGDQIDPLAILGLNNLFRNNKNLFVKMNMNMNYTEFHGDAHFFLFLTKIWSQNSKLLV